MLSVVSTKFQHITTYDVGIASFNVTTPVSDADSTALIPQAAAFLNKERKAKVIDVAIGIFQNENENIQNSEVNVAIDVAQDANGRFPNTVWGLVFTNAYINDERTAEKVLELIRNHKERAKLYKLKVGTRVNICDKILDSDSEIFEILSDIVSELDFIMCNMYPTSNVGDIKQAVDAVGSSFVAVEKAFKNINKNIDVMIGETGWPSEGESVNRSLNSIKNMQAYWSGMNEWATKNSVRTYMLEAFDEPYRGGPASDAYAHYGWWYRQSNNDEVYVEKVTNAHVRG